ncbi:MAG: DUF4234 domain-containing protein [Ruminococcaceae bacterium]|nr:DUF4234 domain-containing protein [Oscillospiraceae bacterium]
MKEKERPVIKTLPAITVACAVLSLFAVAFEFGFDENIGIFLRMSPDFFAGGFLLVLRLIALAVPLSMLIMAILVRKSDARLMLLTPALMLVYAFDQLLYYIRAELLGGTTVILWAVCRVALPLAFLFVLFMTLTGKIKKPFAAAFTSVGALLVSVAVRVTCAVIDRSVTSEVLPEAFFYLGMAAFVMSLEFPVLERAAEHRVFAGTPDQFCPEWEDGDIPEELCEYEDITACVIISVMTFGIYQLVWLSRLCKKIRLLAAEDKKCGKEVAKIALVPFYILYWMRSRGKKIAENAKKLNINLPDNGAFYVLFSLCGLSVFAVAMMQKDFNRIARRLEQTVSAAALQNEEDRKQAKEKLPEGTPASDGQPVATEQNANDEKGKEDKIDTITLLQALKQLRAMGLLTDEEFKDKKQKVLNQF